MILEAEVLDVEVLLEEEIDIAFKQRQEKLQKEADKDFQLFYMTDFSDIKETVRFINAISLHSDNIYIQLPYKHIVNVLEKHGYYASMCAGDDLVVEDPDMYGKFLIGQAIFGLKEVEAIDQWTHYRARDYVKQYLDN